MYWLDTPYWRIRRSTRLQRSVCVLADEKYRQEVVLVILLSPAKQTVANKKTGAESGTGSVGSFFLGISDRIWLSFRFYRSGTMNTMTPSSAAISRRQISFHFSVEIIWIFARGCRGWRRGQRNTRRWTLGPGLWFCKTLASRLSRAVVTVIFVSRRVHGRRVDREAFHCLQLPVWLLFFSFFFFEGRKLFRFFGVSYSLFLIRRLVIFLLSRCCHVEMLQLFLVVTSIVCFFNCNFKWMWPYLAKYAKVRISQSLSWLLSDEIHSILKF